MKIKKKLVSLPPEVREKFLRIDDVDVRNQYIYNLKNAGWTMTSIAEACGITRERARQITLEMEDDGAMPLSLDNSFLIPEPPILPEREPKQYTEPSPEVLKRLLELQPMAQQVRSSALRFREEAEEYTRLIHKSVTDDGVTLYRMAKRLGVTHSALRFRLIRYGYVPMPEGKTSSVYRPINRSHRVG